MKNSETSFWKGKKVLITGHTGFKGSWMSLFLAGLGARIYGYSLAPPTEPNLFTIANIREDLQDHQVADVRDFEKMSGYIQKIEPEIIFHMAAQPLVRDSYKIPIETYDINVMGTVKLLEAARMCKSVRVIVNITTDKVYENKEWEWPYRENDRLGGYDPYSNSKACSELVTSAYTSSYFNASEYDSHGVAIATARAGNVIGGGDFATDRLVPDILRSFMNREMVSIRSPHAVRPWQHVLEPLSGYFMLAEALYQTGAEFNGSFNFGPGNDGFKPVSYIVNKLVELWPEKVSLETTSSNLHEASILKLDYSKAKVRLNWQPRLSLDEALTWIIAWASAYRDGKEIRQVCLDQIEAFKKLGQE